jgi:MtN3 and saliva related transmembrane protein
MTVDGIGYLAALLTTFSFFPQAFKTLRSNDTRAISLSMYSLFTLGLATWALFGVLTSNGPVIAANLVTLVPAVFVLQAKIRHRLPNKASRRATSETALSKSC